MASMFAGTSQGCRKLQSLKTGHLLGSKFWEKMFIQETVCLLRIKFVIRDFRLVLFQDNFGFVKLQSEPYFLNLPEMF